MIAASTDANHHARTPALRATLAMDAETFSRVKLDAIFDCDKWDPQVGDVDVLRPFALEISAAVRADLFARAERMSAELAAIEEDLPQRFDLHAELGLTPALRAVLGACGRAVSMASVARFDFHPTDEGFGLSEVNTDVPGGYNEASGVTERVAREFPGLAPTGDPAGALAAAIAARLGRGAHVAMVHATADADDRQVMRYLGRRLAERGVDSTLMGPHALAHQSRGRVIDGVFRYFPAEWLPELSLGARWWHFFGGTALLLTRPARVLVSQCKRWPLVADRLQARAPELLDALGETREADDSTFDTSARGQWVIKPNLGRVGQPVGVPGHTPVAEWAEIAASVRVRPRDWVAQRRFRSVPVSTPEGPRHVALGVYVVEGRAVGCYARLSRHARVDEHATEVAVLERRGAAL